jgi:CCR4-NOT transcriptional regulation complex NOT5 subunit
MKKCVSIFNSDYANKAVKVPSSFYNKQFLTPTHFSKFSEETLFYIFYYLPRDSLQLYASEELVKRKWRFHIEYNIWFNENDEKFNDNLSEKDKEKGYVFFNPNEWKTMKYTYEPIDPKAFYEKPNLTK